MTLTLRTLISQLSAATPQTPVFSEPSRAVGTPEEVAVAFNELDRAATLNRTSDGVIVHDAVQLSDRERAFLDASIASFNEKVRANQLVVDRSSDGSIATATPERVSANEGMRIDGQDTTQPAGAVAQPSSAGCTWQWWFHTHWWGFDLSFNSCAISWLSAGGKAIDQALNSFKLPSIATPIIKLVALLLKPFDKGNGSTIYVTWIGPFWITAR